MRNVKKEVLLFSDGDVGDVKRWYLLMMSSSGSVGGPKGQSPLERLLGEHQPPPLPEGADYREAAEAIGAAIMQAGLVNPQRFFAVLAEEPSLHEHSDVIWALGAIKNRLAIPILSAAMRSRSAHIRWAAASSLAEYREEEALAALLAALGDRAPSVRHVVIEALGRQGNRRAVDPLRAAQERPANRKSAYTLQLIAQALDRLCASG